jgi:hypothetical protein
MENLEKDSKFVLPVWQPDNNEVVLRSFIETLRLEAHYMLNVCEDLPFERKDAALLRLLDRADKKAVSTNPILHSHAVSDFVQNNEIASMVTIKLSERKINDAKLFIALALENFTYASTGNLQCPLDLGYLLSLWRYGPGSSRGTDATHFCDKILIKQPSCTVAAAPLARLLRLMNHHILAFDGFEKCVFKIAKGSSLSTVPKNAETDRTIATEPLMNMALQLAAGMYIEGALRGIGTSFENQQSLNNALAKAGSIDGLLCTIDLKHASDLITPALIFAIWPAEWYELFMTIRSPCIKLHPMLKDADSVVLHMMSTMGNGFTFPMMTLTILALVYAAVCESEPPLRLSKKRYGVFGDDIICPSKHFDEVARTLVEAGFIINSDKSFFEGPFRESCGGDYYEGYNVTPFYVKSLATDQEVYVAINQVQDWCGRTGIQLPQTCSFLIGLLQHTSAPFYVPHWEDAFAGIRCSQVQNRYYCYKPIVYNTVRKVKNYRAFILSAIGGFCNSAGGDRIRYVKRPSTDEILERRELNIEYEPVRKRFPKGYLNGHDYTLYSREVGENIDLNLITTLLACNA